MALDQVFKIRLVFKCFGIIVVYKIIIINKNVKMFIDNGSPGLWPILRQYLKGTEVHGCLSFYNF